MTATSPGEVRAARRPLPATHAAEVRPAAGADLGVVADVLARAFDGDPVFLHVMRRDAGRARALRRVFERITRDALVDGDVYVTRNRDGAAVCYAAGSPPSTFLSQLRLLPTLAGAAGLRRLGTLLRSLSLLEEHHPHEPHLYVQFVGVVPDRQGRGIGRALLASALQAADAQGRPAYLEATSRDNARLYERLGFRTIRELTLPDGGPVVHTMWREPGGGDRHP